MSKIVYEFLVLRLIDVWSFDMAGNEQGLAFVLEIANGQPKIFDKALKKIQR